MINTCLKPLYSWIFYYTKGVVVNFLPFLVCEVKGLGSRRAEIGPAIEMHTDLKYVYMVYFIEKNRNFICLVLKLC